MSETGAMERWRKTHNTRYGVSDLGRVRNDLTGRILSPVVNPVTGYHAVNLYDGTGHAEGNYVHRLVAAAFLGDGPAGAHVNHINFDRGDNQLSNLEWVTPAANNEHARAGGRVRYATGEGVYTAKLTAAQVREIRAAASSGTPHRVLARTFRVDHKTVGAVVHRRTWRHV